ncbi:MAG: right-handed parallel beta-helix repeat-containing protein [bacterium]|nr:right-handed parallel beta-helix repeat-containing protein [bacterium]
MDRLVVAAALICISWAYADTTFVSGQVTGTWTPAGNPHIVTDDLEIPPRRQLLLENGVRIQFQGHSLTVFGSLICASGFDTTYFTQDTVAHPVRWPGIYVQSPGASAEFRSAVIERSMGIHVDSALVEIYSSTLRDNRQSALNVQGGEYVINGSSFEHCGAGGCGGAIHAYGALGSVGDTRFESCAGLDGGAICAMQGELSLSTCVFLENRATLWGGVIIADSTALTVSGSHFIDNRALLGGALHVHNGPLVQFKYCVFRGNTGNRDGLQGNCGVGLISVGDSMTFENCIFDGNSSSGVSAFKCSTNTMFKECVFVNNSGQVLLSGYRMTVNFSDFWPPPVMGIGVDESLADLATVNQNGDSVDAFGNLVAPPDFLSESAGQGLYYPNFSSPLIDAGDTTGELDWDGTYPEIGLRDYFHIPPVEDLTLLRTDATANLTLRWTSPGQNCQFRVYRSAADEWAWPSVEIIAETADTFFVHQDVLSEPLAKYTYRVATLNCELGR